MTQQTTTPKITSKDFPAEENDLLDHLGKIHKKTYNFTTGSDFMNAEECSWCHSADRFVRLQDTLTKRVCTSVWHSSPKVKTSAPKSSNGGAPAPIKPSPPTTTIPQGSSNRCPNCSSDRPSLHLVNRFTSRKCDYTWHNQLT